MSNTCWWEHIALWCQLVVHCILCRDEIRECGYSLIIDGRSATWSTIKSLLHMFQECLPGQIHVAYIISPSHFLEKKRASMKMGKEKERLEFTTTVVPVIDRLGQYLDMNQVTTELGGLLPYNHKEWMKMRMVRDCMCAHTHVCVCVYVRVCVCVYVCISFH